MQVAARPEGASPRTWQRAIRRAAYVLVSVLVALSAAGCFGGYAGSTYPPEPGLPTAPAGVLDPAALSPLEAEALGTKLVTDIYQALADGDEIAVEQNFGDGFQSVVAGQSSGKDDVVQTLQTSTFGDFSVTDVEATSGDGLLIVSYTGTQVVDGAATPATRRVNVFQYEGATWLNMLYADTGE